MDVSVTHVGDETTVFVSGRLTAATSVDLESVLKDLPDTTVNAVVDFSGLDYLSSAGLRILIGAEKAAMARGGSMVVRHPNEEVMEVFEMTGLADVLTIEP